MTLAADTSHAEDAAQVSLAADLWPPEAIEAIRAASLELLARVGVRVDSAEAEALLQAAGGSPGPQGRVLLPAAAVAAALESCRGEYLMAARDPRRDLSIGPAPGRIHVHNMGEAPAVGDPRTGRSRPATFRDQALAARVMHHAAVPRLHQQPRDAGRRAGRAPPAVLVPRHRRRDRQAHRRSRPGPRLADAGALRDGERRAVGPARRSPGRRHRPRHGVLAGQPAASGRRRLRRHHRRRPARDGRAGAHQPGRRHDGAGVARRRARPAGRGDPRRRRAGAGGRAGRRVRVRRAALGGRSARRPASLRRRPVGARLRRRHAARAPPRPGLRLLRPRHVGAARRRPGRLPAGAAGARRRARAAVHDVRHRRLGRRLHLPRAARRRRRHLPPGARLASSRRPGTRTLSTSTR